MRSGTLGLARHARLLIFVLLAACDFGGGAGGGCGGSGGCVRIHQGDYTFPLKRVITDALRVRVTQGGMDFLTERVRDLVLLFFDADDQGRALIALNDLGLGDLGTSLGPFSATIGDLVISLDLNAVEVDLVPGSSPARLRIRAEDVEVGIVSGNVTGVYDGLFVDGDAECQLGNGPLGRVALLSFEVILTLDTDPGGVVFVDVISVDVDTQDVALDVSTDCGVPACSDGLPPQCGECTTLCGAASLATSLVTFIQDLLDDLIDDLVSVLADDLANLLLNAVFNGQPLAVEGTLDYGRVLAPLLPYLASAEPLGVVARPAGEAFTISGGNGQQGLDITLDAGVETPGAGHPCVGVLGFEPTFETGPPPEFPALLPTGNSYQLALAVSEAVLNEGVWSFYKGGALCIDVDTQTLSEFTAGELDLRAGALDLLIPGVADLAGADAPIRLRLRPSVSEADADLVGFAQSDGETRIAVNLPDARIAIDVQYADHYVRAVGVRADVTLSVAMDALQGGAIALRVADVAIDNTSVEPNVIFANARLDLVVPFIVDAVLGFLGDIPIQFELPTAGLASGFGLPLDVNILDIVSGGAQDDWLVVYAGLVPVSSPMQAPPVVMDQVSPGSLRAFVPQVAHSEQQFQLRVGNGRWSRWVDGQGPHRIEHPLLWVLGEHRVYVRARSESGQAGEARHAGNVRVERRPQHQEADTSGAKGPQAGCHGGKHAPTQTGWLALVFAGLALLRRARGLRYGLLIAILGWGGCSNSAPPGAIACQSHDQCPGGWMCGLDGQCVAQNACTLDQDCCPGAVCFNGWCRPTSRCDLEADGRGCALEGLVCELPWNRDGLDGTLGPGTDGGWCVPAPCAAPAECPTGLACVDGRCIDETDLPCDRPCTDAEACHVLSGKCLPANACDDCAEGEIRWVAAESTVTALECGAERVVCRCGPPPSPPEGRPGREPRVRLIDGKAVVVSYDSVYGDLVVTQALLEALDQRETFVVDGLPEGSPTGEGYRGGSALPGPDRGERPAIAWMGQAMHAVYRDRDRETFRYARFGLNGTVDVSFEIPVEGRAGRFSCLTAQPGSGDPVALVFVENDDNVAKLVQVRASKADPQRSADFVVTVLLERALPAESDSPCANACGAFQVCVQVEGVQQCADVLDGISCSQGACPAHHVCASVEETDEPACHPRVYRTTTAGGLPFGTGLFVTCDSNDTQAVAAYHDGDVGALFSLDWPWVSATPSLVDGTVEAWDAPSVGAHVDIALHPTNGSVGLSYRDATADALRYAERANATSAWAARVVHEGAADGGTADLGAWTSLAYTAEGEPVVAYADVTTSSILVASRSDPDCWTYLPVDVSTGAVTPDIVMSDDGRILLAARGIGFDENLQPLHGLLLRSIERPRCSE